MSGAANADLYDRDFYAWTRDQASRLRALGNDNRFDVAHVAEEIEDLGAQARNALASHVRLALQHAILLAASPAQEPRSGWADEVDHHCEEIRDLLDTSPSLPDHLDLDRLWGRAVRAANRKMARYGEPTVTAAATSPITVGELADESTDIQTLVAHIADALGTGKAAT